MTIDPHVHIFGERGFLPEWYWEMFCVRWGLRVGMTAQEVAQKVLPTLWDPTGEKYIAQMEAAGIDKAVAVCLDWGLVEHQGEAAYPVEELNRRYWEITRKHPKKLYFGVGVDPRRPKAIEIVKRGVQEYGAKVLKYYPPAGFYPNDRAFYPLYETCAGLKLPILMHTGPSAPHLKSKFTLPEYVEEVAADFPELPIICAHAGFGWWRDYLAIARFRTNLYLELGAWNHQAPNPPRRFAETLREMLDHVPGRVIFATDYSTPGPIAPYVQQVQGFAREGPAWGIQFTQKEMDDLMGGTAGRLLGLA